MESEMFSKSFSDRLFRGVLAKGSPLCVGFDPHMSMLPTHLVRKYKKRSDEVYDVFARVTEEFLLRILDRIVPYVAVIKVQFAFFERLGWQGVKVLQRLCRDISDRGILVIGDVKRGDIGSTASAYADAYFPSDDASVDYPDAPFYYDAVTLNPYLGEDSVLPFLRASPSRGVFILVKTSNPSGVWLQDLETSGGQVSHVVAHWVNRLGSRRIGRLGYSDVGAVVGATYPADIQRLRELMPRTPFLIPGFGTQGGRPEDIVSAFNSKGLGGIVNASRSILFAYRNKPYAQQYGEEKFDEAAVESLRISSRQLENAMKKVY